MQAAKRAELASCGAAHQREAARWLQRNFDAVHDAGHVAAVCAQRRLMLPLYSQLSWSTP